MGKKRVTRRMIKRRKKRRALISLIFLIFVVLMVLGSIFSSNKLKQIVTVEAGAKPVEVSQFLKDKKTTGTFVTDLSKIDMKVPGVYKIQIKIGDKVYSSKLEIRDTIAPKGETLNKEVIINKEIEAREFVINIVEVTDIEKGKAYFKEKPDFSKAGVQEVTIILEDSSGNKTELKASLTIKADTEAPKIIGADDQTIYIGEKISYKRDVTVTDNCDEKVELVVDSSAVNLKKAGSYKVIYSATDSSGNKATKTVIIKVKEKPANYVNEEELNSLADSILAKIITNGMTEKEKAWEIFKWVNTHIAYTGYSDKSNWEQDAARGIKKGTGDCFTYYAASRLLLTRAGFTNIPIEKVDKTHYWNLVKYNGYWYHFDAGAHRRGCEYVCFLRTDKEVEEYSTKVLKDHYKFDKSKYPRTPLEPIK